MIHSNDSICFGPSATSKQKRRINEQSFDVLLADEATYVEAHNALFEAIESFFRRIGRESLALLMKKSRGAAVTLDKVATEKVQAIDSTLGKVISKAAADLEREIAKAGEQYSSSQALSE